MKTIVPEGVSVMAIVNRTPDSFYDDGATFGLDAAVRAGVTAADQGAKIVDIGGMPFSPRTEFISAAQEIDRVVPVISGILSAADVIVSVDTWRPEVAAAAIEAGARIINDVTGLADPAMAELVARTGVGVVVAHSTARPHEYPQAPPQYTDVVDEIREFLRDRATQAVQQGIPAEHVILDPGHDLNKHTDHSLQITRQFRAFTDLGHPTLAAVSRKDFIGEALGLPKEDRMEGSLVAAIWCIQQGARIIRMHDVTAAVRAVAMAEVLMESRRPAGPMRHNR